MSTSPDTLPQQLGDGLLLRWATPEDTEAIAAFNMRIHSDNPDEPLQFLGHWTRDLMNGRHPTTQASDFTVVVDENNGGQIVSTLVLISQTWSYAGIPFGVGRPELVGTDAAYRRRGLVRLQMDAVHAKSAARGELVQGITGIPWYYRMFGYEMCVNLHGSRTLYWSKQTAKTPAEPAAYAMRPATPDDIPLLQELYGRFTAQSLIARPRTADHWLYEMQTGHPEGPTSRNFRIITTPDHTPVGYIGLDQWGGQYIISETAVLPGNPLRTILLYVSHTLQQEADAATKAHEDGDPTKEAINRLVFELGSEHPIYDALDRELDKPRKPYAWFIRVPDLPAFIRHIAPALETRLAHSVMDGYSGTMRLNFYTSNLALTWENGKLTDVGPFAMKDFFDCDAFFPDLTFLHLLFGHRTLAELNHTRTDCYAATNDTAVLLPALFPKQPSWLVHQS
jgi:hypothetical protein